MQWRDRYASLNDGFSAVVSILAFIWGFNLCFKSHSGTKPHFASVMCDASIPVIIGKNCEGAALNVGTQAGLMNFAPKRRSITLAVFAIVKRPHM